MLCQLPSLSVGRKSHVALDVKQDKEDHGKVVPDVLTPTTDGKVVSMRHRELRPQTMLRKIGIQRIFSRSRKLRELQRTQKKGGDVEITHLIKLWRSDGIWSAWWGSSHARPPAREVEYKVVEQNEKREKSSKNEVGRVCNRGVSLPVTVGMFSYDRAELREGNANSSGGRVVLRDVYWKPSLYLEPVPSTTGGHFASIKSTNFVDNGDIYGTVVVSGTIYLRSTSISYVKRAHSDVGSGYSDGCVCTFLATMQVYL